jgi:O-antigen ligase
VFDGLSTLPARLPRAVPFGRRQLVVVGVLLLSALLAPRASIYHLGALLGVAGLVILYRQPASGLLALVVASLAVPLQLGTGTKTELNISVLLVLALTGLWVLEMLVRRKLLLVWARPILPLFLLIVVATVAFVAGLEPWIVFAETASVAAQLGGLGVFVLSAAAFLLAAHRIPDLRWLERLTWVFLVAASLCIFIDTVAPLVGIRTKLLQSGAPGSLLFLWLVVLALGQALFNRDLALPWRLTAAGMVPLVFYVTLVRESWASGWVPALVGGVVVVVFGLPRLGIPFLLTGALVSLLKFDTVMARLMSGGNDYSLNTRLEAWRILLDIVKVNPLLGLGPANYYWYTPLFPILGFAVSFNSHNNYVDIYAQTGLLGLVCYLWFMLEVAWLGWRLRTRVAGGFARGYLFGAIGGLAGMLVAGMLGDWVIPFTYNVGFKGFRATALGWMFLGGLLVLHRIFLDRPWESESNIGCRL